MGLVGEGVVGQLTVAAGGTVACIGKASGFLLSLSTCWSCWLTVVSVIVLGLEAVFCAAVAVVAANCLTILTCWSNESFSARSFALSCSSWAFLLYTSKNIALLRWRCFWELRRLTSRFRWISARWSSSDAPTFWCSFCTGGAFLRFREAPKAELVAEGSIREMLVSSEKWTVTNLFSERGEQVLNVSLRLKGGWR